MNTLFAPTAQAEPTTSATTANPVKDIIKNTAIAAETLTMMISTKWEDITEKNRLNLYLLQSKLTEASKSITAAITKELADGGEIYPLKLTEGSTTESVKDIQKAYDATKEFLTVEEFLTCCTIKKTDLQSLYSEKKSLTEEKAEQEFRKAMKGNLATKTGAGKVIVSLEIK